MRPFSPFNTGSSYEQTLLLLPTTFVRYEPIVNDEVESFFFHICSRKKNIYYSSTENNIYGRVRGLGGCSQ